MESDEDWNDIGHAPVDVDAHVGAASDSDDWNDTGKHLSQDVVADLGLGDLMQMYWPWVDLLQMYCRWHLYV